MTQRLADVHPNERRVVAVALPARAMANQVPHGAGIEDVRTGALVGLIAMGPVGALLGAGAGAIKQALQGSSVPADTGLPSRVRLVSLDEIDDRLSFPPGSCAPGAVFGLNPVNPLVYTPLASYHRLALREKIAEVVTLLASLRAESASVQVVRGQVRSGRLDLAAAVPAAVPVKVSASASASRSSGTAAQYFLTFAGKGEPRVPDELRWLEHEPEWRALATARLEHGLKDFTVELRYSDFLGISAEIAAQIEKAGFSLGGSFEAVEEEHWVISGKFANKGLFGW